MKEQAPDGANRHTEDRMKPPNILQMLQHALRVILLVIAMVRPVNAQGPFGPAPGPAFAMFRPVPTPPPARPAWFIHRAPDYRWEGIVIGGIAGGLLFGTAARGLCDDGSSCISPTVLGAVVGGTAGGLFGCFVGMFIPKRHSASTHSL